MVHGLGKDGDAWVFAGRMVVALLVSQCCKQKQTQLLSFANHIDRKQNHLWTKVLLWILWPAEEERSPFLLAYASEHIINVFPMRSSTHTHPVLIFYTSPPPPASRLLSCPDPPHLCSLLSCFLFSLLTSDLYSVGNIRNSLIKMGFLPLITSGCDSWSTWNYLHLYYCITEM